MKKEKQKEAGEAVCQKSDKAVVDTKKELAKVAKVSHDTLAKETGRVHKKVCPKSDKQIDTKKELATDIVQKSAQSKSNRQGK